MDYGNDEDVLSFDHLIRAWSLGNTGGKRQRENKTPSSFETHGFLCSCVPGKPPGGWDQLGTKLTSVTASPLNS